MSLFRNKQSERSVSAPTTGGLNPALDDEIQEPVSELIASGKIKSVDKAMHDAKLAAEEARSADVVGARLVEQGRCPECHSKLTILLYTRVCSSCGWYSRAIPTTGRCIVSLANGETICCEAAIAARGDQVLCVSEGVVRAQIARSFVTMIQHDWEEEELERARRDGHRQKEGVCAWCENVIRDLPEGPVEEYVAFGAFQERYSFCSDKCAGSFRKQYSSRVHRNCYERDCNECNLCIRRYDTRSIKTSNLLPD